MKFSKLGVFQASERWPLYQAEDVLSTINILLCYRAILIYIYIPQTVFSCRGSGGFGKDAGGRVPPPREF